VSICEKTPFNPMAYELAVIVFVKFVEFVANKNRHEFHGLTRINTRLLGEFKAA